MNTDTKRISLIEKLGFGAFSTSSNIVYQFKSLYYLFFLTNVLKIDVLTAGIVLAIGTVWDAVNDPLIGFWAVNHKFKNGERCRPFALWAAVPWAVSIVLLFTDFGTGKQLAVIISLAAYFVFELLYTLVGIPYNSMGGLATNLDADRRSINVHRNIGGCLGSGIGALACLPLLKLFGALDSNGNLLDSGSAGGFIRTAAVMGVICILGCFAHYFTTRERVKPISDNEPRLRAREVFKMLLHCKSWVTNTLYVILYGVNNLLLMSCITYYATYVLHSTARAFKIQAAYLVASLLTSFFVSLIDRAIGRKKTMMVGAAAYILGKIWFVIDPFSQGAIMVNAISVGIGATIAFVMFNTNRNNIVDVIEWNDGRRLDSLVSTADNLASKLAVAAASLLITLSLKVTGFNGAVDIQPSAAINAINAMLGWVPLIIGVLMFIVVSFINLDKEIKRVNEEKAAAGRQ